MRRFRKIGVVLLLVAFVYTPTMTCAFAESVMMSKADECCHSMKQDCGHKQMPATHDCCYRLSAPYDRALAAKSAAVHAVSVTAVWLDAGDLLNPAAVSTRAENTGASPPGVPRSSVTILRI